MRRIASLFSILALVRSYNREFQRLRNRKVVEAPTRDVRHASEARVVLPVNTASAPPRTSPTPAAASPGAQPQNQAEAKPEAQTAEADDRPKLTLGSVFTLLKETITEWNNDRAPQLAAALAYFTVFSIAPLLIISIAVAGAIFGDDVARQEVMSQIRRMVGSDGAILIQSMVENAARPGAGIVATVLGVVTLFTGAAGVFGQLKATMNTIWDVEPSPAPQGLGAILNALKQQLINIGFVLGVGFVLLVSLVVSAVLSGLNSFFADRLAFSPLLFQVVNFAVSFGVITLLFAAIFKFMPDTRVEWRDVWVGAAFTALLFTIGKQLIGLYLGNSSVMSSYGAAGSLVVVLIWIFYSAQILFLGAEFAQTYSCRFGSRYPRDLKSVRTRQAAQDKQDK